MIEYRIKNLCWLILSIIILSADQLTKYIAIINLNWYQAVKVNSFFNFTLAKNTGAAFSFLANNGAWTHWFFLGITTLISVLIFLWMLKPTHHKLQLLALSLVLGGALSNILDRLIHGYVIDFIDIHIKSYHWPIFNVADSAIIIGALLLIIGLSKKA